MSQRQGHCCKTHSIRLLLVAAHFVALDASAADFDRDAERFLEQHCLRCHGEKKQKGELRLDTLSRDLTQPGTAGRWSDVLEKISSGEMPPESETQPAAAERARMVETLNTLLKEGEAARLARREPVSLLKLTREEYVNTVQDLLGVTYDATDPNGMTQDAEWKGFERLGNVLTFSPAHLEKHLAAARAILAEAFPEKRPTPIRERRGAHQFSGGPTDWKHAEESGIAAKARYEVWPQWFIRRAGPPRLPVTGLYRLRIQLSGLKTRSGEAPHLVVYSPELDRVLLERDVLAAEGKPEIIELIAHLPEGNLSVFLRNESPGPPTTQYNARGDGAYAPFLSLRDPRRWPWQLKLTDEEHNPLWPLLIVDWIEWEGPLLPQGPTFAEKNYLPADLKDRAQVEAALHRFASRAYRRSAMPEDVARLMKIYDRELAAFEKPDVPAAAPSNPSQLKAAPRKALAASAPQTPPELAALKTAMAAVLCSRNFLYLVEGDPARSDDRLTDWEIAARLSYFLWSTMPDEPLMAAARAGTLRQPDVLKAEFSRMMADPRARRFSETFPRSWLQLRKLGTFPPDKVLYPDYSKHLETSMARETTEYFRAVLEGGLSLREFLHADWTMLNGRLARHYGVPGVEGDDFRRVALSPEHHRGGLLTQASILSMTSDGMRHRPVHRGVWLAEALLGREVPPPPGNIDPIPTTPPGDKKLSLRAKLDAHKTVESCAECHRKIDPLGLAFENYDAIGRWRTVETVTDGSGENPDVDASGALPDGRKFAGPDEFKALLLADLDKFNAALTEKLAMFALRRPMTYDDRAALANIAAQGKAADFKLAALIEALVLSELFQRR